MPDAPVIDPKVIKSLLSELMSDDRMCGLLFENPELKALYLQFFPHHEDLFPD